MSYIKNNNRKENDVPKGKENLALPRNWNLKKKELSLREKNALYSCTGYVVKSLIKNQNFCKKCIVALVSKKNCNENYAKFVALKEYKTGALHYASENAFQIAILVEQIFCNLRDYLKNNNFCTGNVLEVMKKEIRKNSTYRSIQFPTCCNSKTKFTARMIVYRLKIYTRKAKEEIRKKQRLKWSSKSHAMRDLVENANQKFEKKIKSNSFVT